MNFNLGIQEFEASPTPTDTTAGGTATTYSYGTDVLGSVSQLLDDAGNVKASYGYTAYGATDAPTSDTESLTSGDPDPQAPLNPYRYSSRRMDSGTVPSATPTVASGAGGYDMGARRFGPDLGSFLQQDQFTGALADLGLALDPLTQNRYALAGGNPISYVEWDGHVATTLQQLENINAEPAVTDPDPKTQRLISVNTEPKAYDPVSAWSGGKTRDPFEHTVPQAHCGSSAWGQATQTNPLIPPASSNCGIYLGISPGPGLPSFTVPGTLNLSGGGSGGGPGRPRRFSRAELVQAAEYLREKALRLHAMLDAFGQSKAAFSVVAAQKPNGNVVDVVAAAGESGRLTSRQWESLLPWEVEADPLPKGASNHDAEVKALAFIEKQGWKPLAGGTSRPICPWCENMIRGQGGELVGQTYPSTRMWRQSEQTFIFPG